MLHSTGTWGYYLWNNDLLLHLTDLNNDLLFHSTEHFDALLKIITCSKQWKGALISANRPFSQSETELRRMQLNEIGSPETQPTYNICCKGGRRDWCLRSTTRKSIQMVTHPNINPVRQGLTSVNRQEPVFPSGASWTRHWVRAVSFGPINYEQCLHLSEWVTHLHIGVPARNPFLRFVYPRVYKWETKPWSHCYISFITRETSMQDDVLIAKFACTSFKMTAQTGL